MANKDQRGEQRARSHCFSYQSPRKVAVGAVEEPGCEVRPRAESLKADEHTFENMFRSHFFASEKWEQCRLHSCCEYKMWTCKPSPFDKRSPMSFRFPLRSNPERVRKNTLRKWSQGVCSIWGLELASPQELKGQLGSFVGVVAGAA